MEYIQAATQNKYKMTINKVTDSNVILFSQEKIEIIRSQGSKYLVSSFVESLHKEKITGNTEELLVNFSKCHYH